MAARFKHLLLFLITLFVAISFVQELVPTQQFSASILSQMRERSTLGIPFNFRRCELELSHGANHEEKSIDSLKQKVQDLAEELLKDKEEMEAVKGRLLEVEREIRDRNGTSRDEVTQVVSEPEPSVEFLPLKNTTSGVSHVSHYFMSALKGGRVEEGSPELFFFPHGADDRRLLCLRGNSTSNGTRNAYAFVERVPTGTLMVPGTTLISDTYWDFNNPWHAMFNLLQLVHWRINAGCSHADHLVLFHQGEYRILGNWIKSLLQACGLPTEVLMGTSGVVGGGSHATICFEQAVVSRRGLERVKKPLLSRMFREARCQARRACHIQRSEGAEEEGGSKRRVNVTLVVRQGSRGFVDEKAWQRVVKQQCEAALNCSWSVMHVANLTFCQQVEVMTYTDVLLSVHGAQLTNIIFMEPGRSLMEMFPSGWLEMAGHGQYIYRNLAFWLGLQHEGYWRDPSTTPCPNSTNLRTCFGHYKNQPLGINVTHISNWLKNVITKFQDSSHHPSSSQNQDDGYPLDIKTCECDQR